MTELNLSAGGYLIDLDGTLISGGKLLPDAHWLIEQTRGRHVVMSNNAEHTPRGLSRALHAIDLAIAPEDIVLAGTCAVDEIAAAHPGCSLMLLGSPALKAYARSRGLATNRRHADVVLVARDRSFTYAKLAAAAEALHAGARLYVAAPDLSHPGPNGQPVPETGALAAALAACSGVQPHRIIGKPQRAMFELGRRKLGVEFADMVMIGDNPKTDGLGAISLGMQFHLVQDGFIRSRPPVAAE